MRLQYKITQNLSRGFSLFPRIKNLAKTFGEGLDGTSFLEWIWLGLAFFDTAAQ